MLADLGCQKVQILSNHQRRIAGIEGFGIEVVERLDIQWPLAGDGASERTPNLRSIDGGAGAPDGGQGEQLSGSDS